MPGERGGESASSKRRIRFHNIELIVRNREILNQNEFELAKSLSLSPSCIMLVVYLEGKVESFEMFLRRGLVARTFGDWRRKTGFSALRVLIDQDMEILDPVRGFLMRLIELKHLHRKKRALDDVVALAHLGDLGANLVLWPGIILKGGFKFPFWGRRMATVDRNTRNLDRRLDEEILNYDPYEVCRRVFVDIASRRVQIGGVLKCLPPIHMVNGPSGTGKTTLSANIISAIVDCEWKELERL